LSTRSRKTAGKSLSLTFIGRWQRRSGCGKLHARLPHPNKPGRTAMVAYVVLANFTEQGIRNAKDSPKRAEAFKAMARTFGVTVREIVWTQGRYDIVTILDAPDEASFMSLTLSLGALGNVRTESLRAFSADEMTKAVGGML
jgi:uncharacterized protein with GYD domain